MVLNVDSSSVSSPLHTRSSILFWTGWILCATSFFIPSAYALDDGHVVGWEAFRFALDGSVIMVASALTNFVAGATLLVLLRRPVKLLYPLRLGMVASTAINLYWLIDMPKELLMGYYLWLTSFCLITAALFMRPSPK